VAGVASDLRVKQAAACMKDGEAMFIRRLVLVAAAALLSTLLLAGPALATDEESGSLYCPAGKVVWITERTSAGTTTVAVRSAVRKIVKSAWSTTRTRSGLQSTWWRVSTTGLMDHKVTAAVCGA
jgi:hypothetical protein